MIRQRLTDLIRLLQTPIGRQSAGYLVLGPAWPLLRLLAAAYRRTLIRRTHLVVVVGSFGKTTTNRAVRVALNLSLDGSLRGNAFNRLVQALLAVGPLQRFASIEVGINGPGQMAGYAWMLRPDVVVVTSIGSEHRTSLRTVEQTRQEKAAMVRVLGPNDLLVLNGDDRHVRWMASQTRARVITCGFGPDNAVRASEVALDWPRGTRFRLHVAGQTHPIQVRLLGREQIFSILAAVAVAQAAGLPLETVLARLADLPPTPGRLEPVPLPGGVVLLRDDFKGALETYHSAIALLAEVPARRRLALVGDVSEPPGSQGPIYRDLGARLAACCSQVLVLGSQYQRYAAGATRAGLPRSALHRAGPDVLRAAELLSSLLEPGDVVLVKGQDKQRFERLVLSLLGRRVRCDLRVCSVLPSMSCACCPMLEPGWGRSARAPDPTRGSALR